MFFGRNHHAREKNPAGGPLAEPATGYLPQLGKQRAESNRRLSFLQTSRDGLVEVAPKLGLLAVSAI